MCLLLFANVIDTGRINVQCKGYKNTSAHHKQWFNKLRNCCWSAPRQNAIIIINWYQQHYNITTQWYECVKMRIIFPIAHFSGCLFYISYIFCSPRLRRSTSIRFIYDPKVTFIAGRQFFFPHSAVVIESGALGTFGNDNYKSLASSSADTIGDDKTY